MRKKLFITEIDVENNIAFSDDGRMLSIESYVDKDETPCLPEEASHCYIITGPFSFHKYTFEKEDEE